MDSLLAVLIDPSSFPCTACCVPAGKSCGSSVAVYATISGGRACDWRQLVSELSLRKSVYQDNPRLVSLIENALLAGPEHPFNHVLMSDVNMLKKLPMFAEIMAKTPTCMENSHEPTRSVEIVVEDSLYI